MTEKQFKKLDIIFGWAAFLIAAIVYMLTLEPTVSFWDCGEFISAANKLEVGHPPGAPFFMLVARFFAMFASDATQVAYMVNTFSAMASAFTIMFLYWSIVYFAKRMIASDKDYSIGKVVAIIGAGMIGAMAYTFSDTFWFSAVEGEVYAFSSFFTAIVFWAILKWSEIEEPRVAARWILLIALLIGMSIGVHLLNLLTIPALAFVVYYKKFKPSLIGFCITIAISLFVIAILMWGLIPGVGIVASELELLFVNKFGMPYNSGLIIWVILTIISLGLSIYVTQYSSNTIIKIIMPLLSLIIIGAPFISGNTFVDLLIIIALGIGAYLLVKNKKEPLLNLIVTSFAFIMIGYSSYAVIVIRSNADPPMDQNSPDNVFNLLYYLNREQYGDRPLGYGEYYNAQFKNYEAVSPYYIQRNGKYEIVGYREKAIFDSKDCTVFPRMFSRDPEHIEIYKSYGGIKKSQKKPGFSNNLSFFVNYQMNWMYWRYFMWNFAGRQNDIQGDGSVLYGNWKSGIDFIDNPRLGDQDMLPDHLKDNKANNKYYMLPLLLGLIGLVFQLFKHLKDWWIVSLLFILTGIAIVVYLNQTPNQPRERDYAYAGSFYAFAVWIGLGVVAVYELLRKFSPGIVAGSVATLICIPVPYIMGKENWDDHDRSNRYIARDFAHNYLNSCAPNAILFTHGDNDTFPIWYAQEVEGIRTDVKVCCLPYLASDWYIDQMKMETYEAQPMPFILTRDKYEPLVRDVLYYAQPDRKQEKGYISVDSLVNYMTNDKLSIYNYGRRKEKENLMYIYPKNKIYLRTDTEVVLNNGTVLPRDAGNIDTIIRIDLDRDNIYKNEMMILDMLRNNNWERPVYFTSINSRHVMGLNNYFQNEGFAYRLVPIKSNSQGRINEDILYDNLMNKYEWGNMNDPDVLIDNTISRTTKVVKIRENFSKLAISLAAKGDTVRARKVMTKCDSIMPKEIHTPGYFDINYADGWYAVGDNEKGDDYLKEIFKNCSQELDFFASLDRNMQKMNSQSIQIAAQLFYRALRSAEINNRAELSSEMSDVLDEYMRHFESVWQ
ncbi:MAG: DUF2723 domain-containing protein [Bacteroidales bacterium]|jgi:hypothetical protein|nr:DUF2723 domain-containing protein [Bacteroidales bacterium]